MRSLLLILILMSVIIQPPSGSATPAVTRGSQSSWRTGREYFTDFSSSAADAFLFDITGFDYTTDGGPAAIHLTDPAVRGYLFTKDKLKDADVLVKIRVAAEGIYDITNVNPVLHSRHIDANNGWTGVGLTTDGNNRLAIHSIKASVDAGSSTAVGTFNNTDHTNYRWIRLRLIGDAIYMKWWIDGALEPAWLIVERLRAPAVTDSDNIDIGTAGLSTLYGGFIQSLKVTELLRVDNNLIVSPAPTDLATSTGAMPIGWSYNAADGTNVRSIASIAGPDGDTRPVFKIIRTATGETGNSAWTQKLWRGGSANAFLTRKMPWPRVEFPGAIEVSLWTKGASVANAAGSLATAFVAYYYDDAGTVLNFGRLDYFSTLGPNGATGGQNGKKGDGTWNWTNTIFRMALANPERVTSMNIDVGFHDATATGTLWFTDLQLMPVP